MDEPIADISRATLDGHIVLKRSLASAGHYPPIDVLESVSRLMARVASPGHAEAARRVRALLAAYEEARDLIAIGAYVAGSDALVDRAVERMPAIEAFLRQRPGDVTDFETSIQALGAIDPQPEVAFDDDDGRGTDPQAGAAS
jgi:flagellar biosynthesis/type III secretory pathway ATPase